MTPDLIETMARAIEPDVWFRGAEYRGRQDAALAKARAALKAAEEAGWVLVPKEPTKEMWKAGIRHLDSECSNMAWWRALIAARPSPPGSAP